MSGHYLTPQRSRSRINALAGRYFSRRNAMRRSLAFRRLLSAWLTFAIWLLAGFGFAPLAAQPPGDVDQELVRQKQIVERFVSVLERTPRRGTAFDKVYGFHVENGSVDEFAAQLRARV